MEKVLPFNTNCLVLGDKTQNGLLTTRGRKTLLTAICFTALVALAGPPNIIIPNHPQLRVDFGDIPIPDPPPMRPPMPMDFTGIDERRWPRRYRDNPKPSGKRKGLRSR